MRRPRVHDLDHLLDVAEALAVESGPAAVTIRALSELTSVSNGAIYHAFGSRAGLLGRVWLRGAQRMLTVQRGSVDDALATGTAVDAIVAAADAPARFLLDHPTAGQFLMIVSRRELLGSNDIPDALADDLRMLDSTLVELFVRLSTEMWNRADRTAVAVIKDCTVELPAALLLRGRRAPDASVRERLAAAVRGVLTLPPPPPPPKSS